MFLSIFKFDENQPRDKNGRWATTMGFAEGEGPAMVFSKKINKPHYSAQELVSKAFGGNADLIAEFEAAHAKVMKEVEAGGESYRQHVENLADLDSGKAKRPRYTAARLQMHREIINSILGDTSKFLPKDGEAPEVIFLGGRGGSGKGNFDSAKRTDDGSPLESAIYDRKTHLLLDPDEVKQRMKDYSPEKAYLVHRESAHIFDRLVSKARRLGLNVVLDTTMRSSVNSVVSSFEREGYSMQAHFMHMPPEGAALRALKRWEGGERTPSGAYTPRGRLVPPEVIYGMVNNEKNFDAVLHKMKAWSVWANDRPLQQGPRKITDKDSFKGSSKVLKGFSCILVEKGNPYHAANGQFSSADDAVSVSSKGAMTVFQIAGTKEPAHLKVSVSGSVESVFVPEEDRRKGLAEKLYMTAAQHYKDKGKTLSSGITVSSKTKGLWEKLVSNGVAEVSGDGYAFKAEADLSLVQKANPYHDARGRFTSRANAGFVSLWGKDYANIDAPANLGANLSATQHHQQKVKEFAHILGVHVRGGGTANDAFGKTALSMAEMHAAGVKGYGTHLTPGGASDVTRNSLEAAVAGAFAASNLTAAQKVKAGIPLTDEEKTAIEKSKEYDKKHYSKKQVEKVHADLEAMSEQMQLMAADPNFSPAAYSKLSKKMAKTISLGGKHGATATTMEAAISKGKAKVEAKKSSAKAELESALSAMYHATAQGDSAAESVEVGTLMAKHEGLLSKDEFAAVGASAKAKFNAKKEADHEALYDAYSKLHYAKAQGSTASIEEVAKAQEAYTTQYSKMASEYGQSFATESLGQAKSLVAAKKATGKTPVSEPVQLTATPGMVDILAPEKSTKPGVASPSSFKAPKTKAEALDVAKAMGKQFYLLKEGKYPNASKDSPPKELADAHALYEKAKDAYVAHGGSKSEFSSISTDLKNSAKNALSAEKEKAKTASANAYSALAYASQQLAKAKDAYGATSEQAKAAAKDLAMAKSAAKGVVNANMHEAAIQEGLQTYANNKKAKKAAALQEVHEASYALNAALIKHKKDPEHEDVLKAASEYDAVVSKHAGSKMFSASELAAETASAKSKAKANAKAQAEFAKKYGSASKVVASYDKEKDSFAYPALDADFTDHGVQQVKKLTSAERDVVSSYTGSAFTALNRAVGKAGTAKMQGAAAEPLTTHQKEQMKAMDSAFAKTTLGKNVKLRRNMPQKYFWEQLGISLDKVATMSQTDLDKVVGRVYKETAFSSTSMRSNFSSSFANESSKTGGAVLRIRAGANMPGLRAKSISNHEGEDEVILPRGTTYVIRKITPYSDGHNNKFEIHVDMIGAFPDAL